MSSDNPTADRLLDDARQKTATQDSPILAWIGVAVALVGLTCLCVFGDATQAAVAGWVAGAIGAGLGLASIKKSAAVKLAKGALVLGILSVLGATFIFCYAQAVYS